MDMTRMLRLWIIGWLGVCVPLLILLFGLGLDVSRSPAWQVALFYLLFIPFSLMWGAGRCFSFCPGCLVGGGMPWDWELRPWLSSWRWAGGWMVGSLGFRNPLLGDLLALFAVVSALSVVIYRLIRLSARCVMRGHAGLE